MALTLAAEGAAGHALGGGGHQRAAQSGSSSSDSGRLRLHPQPFRVGTRDAPAGRRRCRRRGELVESTGVDGQLVDPRAAGAGRARTWAGPLLPVLRSTTSEPALAVQLEPVDRALDQGPTELHLHGCSTATSRRPCPAAARTYSDQLGRPCARRAAGPRRPPSPHPAPARESVAPTAVLSCPSSAVRHSLARSCTRVPRHAPRGTAAGRRLLRAASASRTDGTTRPWTGDTTTTSSRPRTGRRAGQRGQAVPVLRVGAGHVGRGQRGQLLGPRPGAEHARTAGVAGVSSRARSSATRAGQRQRPRHRSHGRRGRASRTPSAPSGSTRSRNGEGSSSSVAHGGHQQAPPGPADRDVEQPQLLVQHRAGAAPRRGRPAGRPSTRSASCCRPEQRAAQPQVGPGALLHAGHRHHVPLPARRHRCAVTSATACPAGRPRGQGVGRQVLPVAGSRGRPPDRHAATGRRTGLPPRRGRPRRRGRGRPEPRRSPRPGRCGATARPARSPARAATAPSRRSAPGSTSRPPAGDRARRPPGAAGPAWASPAAARCRGARPASTSSSSLARSPPVCQLGRPQRLAQPADGQRVGAADRAGQQRHRGLGSRARPGSQSTAQRQPQRLDRRFVTHRHLGRGHGHRDPTAPSDRRSAWVARAERTTTAICRQGDPVGQVRPGAGPGRHVRGLLTRRGQHLHLDVPVVRQLDVRHLDGPLARHRCPRGAVSDGPGAGDPLGHPCGHRTQQRPVPVDPPKHHGLGSGPGRRLQPVGGLGQQLRPGPTKALGRAVRVADQHQVTAARGEHRQQARGARGQLLGVVDGHQPPAAALLGEQVVVALEQIDGRLDDGGRVVGARGRQSGDVEVLPVAPRRQPASRAGHRPDPGRPGARRRPHVRRCASAGHAARRGRPPAPRVRGGTDDGQSGPGTSPASCPASSSASTRSCSGPEISRGGRSPASTRARRSRPKA